MKPIVLAVFGWLVPGGAYLLMRRYVQFAVFAVLVSTTFAAGLALHGGLQWPQPADLQGLDPFTALVFKAGALAKLLAGARSCSPSSSVARTGSSMDACTSMEPRCWLAGLLNLLAISTALELRKAER